MRQFRSPFWRVRRVPEVHNLHWRLPRARAHVHILAVVKGECALTLVSENTPVLTLPIHFVTEESGCLPIVALLLLSQHLNSVLVSCCVLQPFPYSHARSSARPPAARMHSRMCARIYARPPLACTHGRTGQQTPPRAGSSNLSVGRW
jgi:hypothetical protein